MLRLSYGAPPTGPEAHYGDTARRDHCFGDMPSAARPDHRAEAGPRTGSMLGLGHQSGERSDAHSWHNEERLDRGVCLFITCECTAVGRAVS